VSLIRDWYMCVCKIPCCRLVFKLTDFGATREMSPHVDAQTLYGTEEYLVSGLLMKSVFFSTVKASCCHSIGSDKCITTEHGLFSRIFQIVPMCTDV